MDGLPRGGEAFADMLPAGEYLVAARIRVQLVDGDSWLGLVQVLDTLENVRWQMPVDLMMGRALADVRDDARVWASSHTAGAIFTYPGILWYKLVEEHRARVTARAIGA